MSLQIESCKPFLFYTDSPSLTLDEIKVKFPTATKALHIATSSGSPRGKELYLVWAGYEILIDNTPVFGTDGAALVTEPNGNFLSIVQGIYFPTDRIRLIADYTPAPSSSKKAENEVFEDEPRNKE